MQERQTQIVNETRWAKSFAKIKSVSENTATTKTTQGHYSSKHLVLDPHRLPQLFNPRLKSLARAGESA